MASYLRNKGQTKCLEDIYIVPVSDKYILMSPLRRVFALVNEAALADIQSTLTDPGGDPDPALKDLISDFGQCVSYPGPPSTDGLLPSKVVVMPTRRCNMKCVYCNFGSHNAAQVVLEPRHACRIVDYAASCIRSHGQKLVHVHFFGGEPLLEEKIIEVVVHHTRQLCARHAMEPHFEVTTNGLIGPDFARFVGHYLNVVVVSFDGMPVYQDRYRPLRSGQPSSVHVCRTLDVLSECPVELQIRVCVTNQSVSHMPEIADWLCRRFKFDVLEFAAVATHERQEEEGLSSPDPYLFAQNFLLASERTKQCGVRSVTGLAGSDLNPRFSACPVGMDAIMLMPDGAVTACYLDPEDWVSRGLDFTLGRITESQDIEISLEKVQRIRQIVSEKPRCSRCFCRWYCAGGCHVTQTYPGSSHDYNDGCFQVRLLTTVAVLSSLGCTETAKQMLACSDSVDRLVRHKDDRLNKWNSN